MKIIHTETQIQGIRFSFQEEGEEIGHAYLYFLRNDSSNRLVGYMEDVFIEEKYRGSGMGTKIVQELILEAKKRGCYKLIGTSRTKRERVHALYERLGFKHWGKEFRMDLLNAE